MKTKILLISSGLLFCACSNPLPISTPPSTYQQGYTQQGYYQQNQGVYQQQDNQTQYTQPEQYQQQNYYQNSQQNPYLPQYPVQNYSGILPQNVINYIQSNYPNTFITDIDYKGYGWEVELSNNLEVFFDKNGNYLGAQWD
ncbi:MULTISPECIES: PepSY-like domain-containing protein [unclassified Campylobacter]|uniref:PepSY-like domain-containing protein n=1 Tax=unclassified Campylobacter TaxID=2593542 RepID=UPI001237C86B|nr:MULTISPECIES: PepSY-like domain-containing protein [unclassified Campylobacter]KAA6225035.1 hypothetical protein FMM54_06735 [Campylobacter sp. LR185c]KAA6225994.1 hypothetical protein FMM55_05580 [Campylobacter sp. LR196d]KAA6226061.1 hypothetical protein FMM57_06610 [Campylobacter sp. LR286c]KAA6230364.1 hypothetical protein FMM56_06315 [Campylobacter sp. LR264d]KAA6230989.1 hypothetical protein FMM58_03975 [Campylobacter sp. LR291e]